MLHPVNTLYLEARSGNVARQKDSRIVSVLYHGTDTIRESILRKVWEIGIFQVKAPSPNEIVGA